MDLENIMLSEICQWKSYTIYHYVWNLKTKTKGYIAQQKKTHRYRGQTGLKVGKEMADTWYSYGI